jgi:hypothetical protein
MAITNVSVRQSGLPNQSGKGTVTIIDFTYPATTANATLNVGNISSYDLVDVYPVQAVTGSIGIIEIKASRTASNQGQGSIVVGYPDGVTGPAATMNCEAVIYRN